MKLSDDKPMLVLASASPRRRDLLESAGMDFVVHASHVAEDDVPGLDAAGLALHHARNKAEAVAPLYPDAVTLGADTVVVLDGEVFGKPRDMEEARWMLQRLAGRKHLVITAVCLLRAADMLRNEFTATTVVEFLPLEGTEIDAYLERINPLDKAGAYAAQEHADLIIKSVEGSFHNVVGLPVEMLPERLAAFCASARRQSTGQAAS